MTIKQAKQIYKELDCRMDYTSGEWRDVRDELELVVAAKNEREAGKVFEWWGCWGDAYKIKTPTGFARKVRQIWKRIK
jgi:hypothetical protein